MLDKIIIQANAKINLTLDIVGLREDGYHELKSVMQSLSLCDEIALEKNISGAITISCNKANIPCDERNIVYKAASRIFDYANITDRGLHIYIEKRIPSEAGMGGGSADAAAVIKAIVNMYELKLSTAEIYDLAVKIGADVPFCYHGGTCLCEGIGEKLSIMNNIPDCYVLICKPAVGVSTKEAYSKVDEYPQKGNFSTDVLCEAIAKENISIEEISKLIYNHFDEALKIPEVQIIKKSMLKNGALASMMTGSGSAVFGIYETEEMAKKACDDLQDMGEVFITKPCLEVNKII